MRSGGDVIGHDDRLPVAYAAQGHVTLAVLSGLERIACIQLAARARDLAEGAGDVAKRGGVAELSGDYEHGVVRLIVLPVEGREAVDGHVLDIGAGTDGRF